MATGRNAPCPCGSGKKYKACCLRLRLVNPQAPARVSLADTASRAARWEADIQPIMTTFKEDPQARPASLMIMAEGLILHSVMLRSASPEIEGFAAELEAGIRVAMGKLHATPKVVEVRGAAVAEVLAKRLAVSAPGLSVRAGEMASIDDAQRSLAQHLGNENPMRGICSPATWAAWGQPKEWVAEIFAAAALCFETRPWQFLDSDSVFTAVSGVGRTWYAGVLGSGGYEAGLALYSHLRDFEKALEEVTDTLPRFFTGKLLSLTFNDGADLVPAMRKEVLRAGWPLAGPAAYPTLFTIGCLGGGLSRADAEDLLEILQALNRWAAAAERDASLLEAETWQDEVSGARFEELLAAVALGVTPSFPLQPAFAQGPGADPRARVERLEAPPEGTEPWSFEWIGDFGTALAEESLKTKTIHAHAVRVGLFLTFLESWAQVTLPALHEYDLRFFLFSWYPRKVMGETEAEAKALLGSLKRFFQFLDEKAGISCPWAKDILSGRQRFLEIWRAHRGIDPPVSSSKPPGSERLDPWQEIEERALTFGETIPGVLEWLPYQGVIESNLQDELQTLWLFWREEVIQNGITDSRQVLRLLEARAAAWLQETGSSRTGMSRLERIHQERLEIERRHQEREQDR